MKNLLEGDGQIYDQIEVIHIRSSNTIDKTSIIPGGLDISDYQAVTEYYGIQK